MKTTTETINAKYAYAVALLTYRLLVADTIQDYRFAIEQTVAYFLPNLPEHRRKGIAAIVEIAVGLILFATLGFVALTMLQTSSTSGWSSSVATVAVTVVGILAAIAVALTFYHYAKQASTF